VDAGNIPDSFLLLFSESGPVYHASVTWRRGTEVGAQLSANSPASRVSAGAFEFLIFTQCGDDHVQRAADVCFWHKADIATVLNDVRFWGKSGRQ
jgi:hypothetical protein